MSLLCLGFMKKINNYLNLKNLRKHFTMAKFILGLILIGITAFIKHHSLGGRVLIFISSNLSYIGNVSDIADWIFSAIIALLGKLCLTGVIEHLVHDLKDIPRLTIKNFFN